MSKYVLKAVTALLAVIFSFCCPLSAFDQAALEAASFSCESKYGECAAVILETTRARIMYTHNKPCVTEQRFPPGSLVKVFSAAVLLEHAKEWGFNPSRPVVCNGNFIPAAEHSFTGWDGSIFNLSDSGGGKGFRCSVRDGHGKMDLGTALARSCNVYFLTRASLSPSFYNELNSMWKLDTDPVSGRAYSREQMTPFMRIASAIGEGGAVRLTPLKVAQCFSALYEGTPLLIPTESGSGKVQSPLNVSEMSRRFVISTLSRTLRDGTLRALEYNGVKVLGGKTGTATHYRRKYVHHGWVALVFEKNGTRYCLVTFVAKGSGSKEAARYAEALLGAVSR